MKSSISILAMAAILSITSAAPSPAGAAAAKPEGYIITFNNEICEEVENSGGTQTVLPENDCIDIAGFYSFRAGEQDATRCPPGDEPRVNVYKMDSCEGGAIETPELAANGQPSQCQAIVLDDYGLAAASARFVCLSKG